MATAKTTKRTTKKTVRKTTSRPARSAKPAEFLSFQPSMQTFYWLILGILVIALAFWVLTLSIKIQRVYDQIDQQSALMDGSGSSKEATPKQKRTE